MTKTKTNNNKMGLEEEVAALVVEYPGIEIIKIGLISEMPKGSGYFKWYSNRTIKETIIEHKRKTGWIPARIFVNGEGHYVMCREKHLEPEIITKRG